MQVGDQVRVIRPAGTCCGVGCCGTVDTIVGLFHSSPFSRKARIVVYELQSGLIVKQNQLEKV